MEKTVDRAELIKALQMVIPGTAKGEALLSGTDTLVFSPDLIQTYNSHLSVSYPINVGVEGAVKAAELTKIVSKMSGSTLNLKSTEQNLTISDDNTDLEMALVDSPVGNLAAALDLESLDWDEYKLHKEFIQGITLCLFSVSKNHQSHGTLTGVRVDGNDILSTDNFRASFFRLENPMPAFTIPGGSVTELLKIPNLDQFAISTAWAHFQNQDGVIFSAKIFATEYPSEAVKNLFPQEAPEVSYSVPKGLDKALEQAAILSYSSESGGNYVSIYRERGKLVCKGEKEFGSIKTRIPVTPEEWPEGIAIDINPQFLKDIMTKSRKFYVTDSGLVVFGGDNFYHLMTSIKK
jgi:DNA polymerase III sliding clamp (beta) subunit (PCNA family)